MKKIGLTLIGMLLLSSVGFASPMMDYSKGKAGLDLNYRFYQDMDATANVSGQDWSHSFSDSLSGKGGLELGATLGLGNNFALQYKGLEAEANKTYPLCDNLAISLNPKIRSHEYNVLYNINKNFSAFAGLVRVTPNVNVAVNYNDYYEPQDYASTAYVYGINLNGQATLGAKDKNIGQVGIIATTKIFDKTNLYGIAAFGKDYRNLEAGVGYEFSKDWELNVNYRSAKYDNLQIANGSYTETDGDYVMHESLALTSDVKTKGWGVGVSYKF
ncbi:MAG: outer membrane beta-barrel protein [Sporomusaceae bacterium]|nr:outer membrane beta-barrel protein [Sporomusaceae bacterium]